MADNQTPLFSIITVTLNNRAGLVQTYESLAAQTLQNYEWIVIDGASIDGSVEFLKSETNRITQKTIISEADEGIYAAMNKGIGRARGDYLWFLNAGDTISGADILATLTSPLLKEPDFLYGDALEGAPPALKPARRAHDVPWGMFTHHQAMMYRSQTVRGLQLRYSLLYDIASDYDFTVRFLKGARRVIYIPKPLCVFEMGGVSQRRAKIGRREQFEIRQNLALVGGMRNIWIYSVQAGAWWLKALSPSLYKWIKARIQGFKGGRKK